MPLDCLPSAVLGLCLSWLPFSESAAALRICHAWLDAVAAGPRSRLGAICLSPRAALAPGEIDREWSATLDRIVASPLRRRMGELALPWTAVLTKPSELKYLESIATSMPQLERLVLSLHHSLLPLSSFPLPAQLRELKLQLRERSDNVRLGGADATAEDQLDQALAATLDILAATAPQLRALTVHVGLKGSYSVLGPRSMDPLVRMKQLERLCIEVNWRSVGEESAECRLLRALGSEMPALRTLIIDSAEWDWAEEWRSCPKGKVYGAPAWSQHTLAMLVSGPRDQCVLEYIGSFDQSVTRDHWSELCRIIPTLMQPYDPKPADDEY